MVWDFQISCVLLLCRPELDETVSSSSDESVTHEEVVSHAQPETTANEQVVDSEDVVQQPEEPVDKPPLQEKPDFKQVW